MNGVLSFLNSEGVVAAVIGWVIWTLLSYLWAKFKLLPLFREHIHTQKLIADRLDTSTPGGLADLVDKNLNQ